MNIEKLSLTPPQLDSFGSEAYGAITAALMQYTRNVLTTKAMAAYMLQTMKSYSKGMITSANPRLVLYLTHQDHDMDKGEFIYILCEMLNFRIISPAYKSNFGWKKSLLHFFPFLQSK